MAGVGCSASTRRSVGTLPPIIRIRTGAAPGAAARSALNAHTPSGESLVRVLRFRGVPVEIQNYIDDTGVQVADVVVGFRLGTMVRVE
mgnify:CR=1 FL=1